MTGEFARIDRFFKPLAAGFPGALDLSDDAALLADPPDGRLVMTTDAMVEGVHWLAGMDPSLLAGKLLRVNLSDLAAMGARPWVYSIVTALPDSIDDAWLEAFSSGLNHEQTLFDINLSGGDSVSTPGPAMLSVTALGTVQGSLLTRSGAQPDDAIYVTGSLGDAALGLEVQTGRIRDLPPEAMRYLAYRYERPTPRIALGVALAERELATAVMDVSDGLFGDLEHIAAASSVGVRIDVDSLPLSEAAQLAVAADPSRRDTVLAGGDDYELLVTVAPDNQSALEHLARQCSVPLARIGHITPEPGIEAWQASGVRYAPRGGWRHF